MKFEKRVLFVCALALAVFSFSHTDAQASNAWYLCDVISIGSGFGYQSMVVSGVKEGDPNTTVTNLYVYFDLTAANSTAKAQLATALTALALGQQVRVLMDPADPVRVWVRNLQLMAP